MGLERKSLGKMLVLHMADMGSTICSPGIWKVCPHKMDFSHMYEYLCKEAFIFRWNLKKFLEIFYVNHQRIV